MRRLGLSLLLVVSAILVGAFTLQMLEANLGRVDIPGTVLSTEEAAALYGATCGSSYPKTGGADCTPSVAQDPCKCVRLVPSGLYYCVRDEYPEEGNTACPYREDYMILVDCFYTNRTEDPKNCSTDSYDRWDCVTDWTWCNPLGYPDPDLCKEPLLPMPCDGTYNLWKIGC